jgi:hypothetical protein
MSVFRPSFSKTAVLAVVVLAASSMPAWAVIDPGMPLPNVMKMAGYVVVGQVTATDAKTQIVTAKIVETVAGKSPADTVAIDLSASPKVFAKVQAGGPVVIFGARIKGCSLHIADTLNDCPASAAGTPPTWRVTLSRPGWRAFPGTTAQLVDEVKKLASAPAAQPVAPGTGAPAAPPQTPRNLPKYGNYIHFYFPRYIAVTTVRAKPVFMQCADINGDNLPDLLVGYDDGVQMLQCTSGGFTKLAFKDVTADCGLSGAKSKVASFELYRTDGKASLLIGRTLYTNRVGKFAASPVTTQCPDSADVLAAGLVPAGAGKLGVLYVTRAGQLYVNNAAPVTLWKENPSDPSVAAFFQRWGADDKTDLLVVRNSGPVRYALGGSAADDAIRLSGNASPVASTMKVVCATPISIDGTDLGGKPGNSAGADLYIVSADPPDLAIYNRTQGFYIFSGKVSCWRNGPGLVTQALIAKAKGGTWGQAALGLKGKPKVSPIAVAAGDFNRNDKWEELLFVTPDLKLYVADNIRWPWNDDTAELIGP